MTDMRQQILEAAGRAIEARGLGRVTTREIAREAGCADGTLYVHFPHKEDLFFAVVQENVPAFTAMLREDLVGERPLGVGLEEVASAAVRYYAKLIPMSASLFADGGLLARQREAMEERGVGPHLLHERVAEYVEAEQRLGRIDGGLDPLGVAALLLGPCFQYAFLERFTGKDPLPGMTEEQFVSGLVRTLVAGLTPRGRYRGGEGRRVGTSDA